MLSTPATDDLAPFEGDLRAAFGAPRAEAAVRALHFVRGASSAAGRGEAFDRALAIARLLLAQGADPETIAAALVSQALPERELDLDAIQSAVRGGAGAPAARGVARGAASSRWMPRAWIPSS